MQSDLLRIMEDIVALQPAAVIIDSIQTIADPNLGSKAGGVTQVCVGGKECVFYVLEVGWGGGHHRIWQALPAPCACDASSIGQNEGESSASYHGRYRGPLLLLFLTAFRRLLTRIWAARRAG
jgi:hypothetical protein